MMAAIMMRGCSVQQTPLRQPCCLAACLTCFQTSGVRNSRIEPESDSERLARRCACLADAREEEAEVCAAMGPSLFPWGFWEKPRHDDKRRSHVLGQFPQGRPTPSPYQTTTPSTSHPNSSSALGDPAAAGNLRLGHRAPGRGGRRASIPLHALTTLLSALGAFGLCEFRVSQQISTFYGPSVQAMETRLGARQRRRPPTVHRGRTHAPRLQRPVASEDEASACSELRL